MYDQQKEEHLFGAALTLAATGVNAASVRKTPGLKPVKIRGLSVTVTTALTTPAATVTLKQRPTPGSSSGEVSISTVTVPASAAVGGVYYRRDLDTVISPGDEIVVDVTAASAAGAGTIIMEFEPAWDNPGNNTSMVKVTS